jgi:hypothetical protein
MMDKAAQTGIQEAGTKVPLAPATADTENAIREPGVQVPLAEVGEMAPAVPPEPVKRSAKDWVLLGLKALASLQLTVILFALGIFIVLAGTLAQVDAGTWTAVSKYFRSFFVWIPIGIFLPRVDGELAVTWSFPFPGGWLIGSALLVNLLAAHAVRFKVSWKRSGILILHLGLIVMLLGELVTGLMAVEGHMVIEEGKTASFIELSRQAELAIIDSSDPKTDDVVAIPDSFLKKKGLIQNELLPFDVEVIKFYGNSKLVPGGKGPDNPATVGAGLDRAVVELGEVSGVSQEQKMEVPSAYVAFQRKGDGKPLGTYLVSLWLDNQPLTVDGKTYQVLLRSRRTYFPFTLHLIEFRHDKYLGTEKPKNYSSKLRLVDPTQGEDREVLIKMNSPLFYAGRTFYQADYLQKNPGDPKGTILQVVRNPGWLMPYISCVLVSVGMLIHFGMHLTSFLGIQDPLFLVRPVLRLLGFVQ